MSDDKPKPPPPPPPPASPRKAPPPRKAEFKKDISKVSVIDTTPPGISDTLKPVRPRPGKSSGKD